ncbi:MAG: glycoside hydrolase family 25 protein [Solirubrobacterales bacterium]
MDQATRQRRLGPARAIAVAIALAILCVIAAASAPAEAGKRPPGIDVSRFQETIDWAQVRGAGIGFAFVQASRGSGADCAVVPESCGADPYWAYNYATAKANGVRVGPYHRAFVGDSGGAGVAADAAAEAEVFIAAVRATGGLVRGDVRPALDVETPFAGLTPKQLAKWVRVWVKRVRRALGARPVIYTNATSWRATGDTREFARSRHPLWVANWNVRRPAIPARNWAGKGWAVWQWTSSGSVPGISGRVDMNRLRVKLGKLLVR